MTGLGSSIELFFADGQPDGMVTAEMFNWTGHVLRSPRTLLKDALQRPETRGTGVYLLLDDLVYPSRAYVGEAEDISRRIRDHDARKDWWTVAVICTTSANSLNKAHAQYLESKLVEAARTVKAVGLENSTQPALPGLDEAARSNMESFLKNLFMILPAIRVDIFNDKTRPSPASGGEIIEEDAVRFELNLKREEISAFALLANGEFVVQPGSDARREWIGTHTSYRQLREDLIQQQVITPATPHYKFAKSYAFRSPSAASAVVVGRPDNGRTSWRHVASGQTYAEWEEINLLEGAG